jgi:uncharacterized protein (DUF1501 family)
MSETHDANENRDAHERGEGTRAPRAVSRRRFLTGLGAATGVIVAGRVVDVWGPAARAATATAAPVLGSGHAGRTLVVLELGGGNDGLNTVVPHADPAYARLRPTLGVTDPVDLDGQIGFDPHLAKLAARYRAGQVAIVEGIGYPNPDLSHFASMAVWWSADPAQRVATGWLGRYLDGTVGFDDPLAGVVIGTGPSPAVLGDHSFATTIADAGGLQPRLPGWVDGPSDLVAAWSKFAPAKVSTKTLVGQVEHAVRLTGDARTRLARDLAPAASTTTAGHTPSPPSSVQAAAPSQAGPSTDDLAASAPVAADLTLAAQLVASDDAPRVIYVSTFGDFDTHQGEAQRHPALMQELDAGIDAFLTTLESAGAADRAVLMTTSEFGRRPAENGSGTDHGTAAAHLVVGAGVKGGRYGAPPSLTQLDPNGNPVMTVDFRAYFATMLHGWLGVDPEAVVGPGYAPIPLFA